MRKLLVIFVCFILATTVWALVDNQSNDLEPAPSLGASAPVWQTLEDLNANERGNAIIEIECGVEAISQANLIEEAWNSGNYDEAIELLKNSTELDNAAIGIQWKEPIKVSTRWGGDVRIGTRDTIKIVSLDVDNSNGHLFATLQYQQGSGNYWCVNISTDTGKTWAETYSWGSITSDIDGIVYAGYYYVGYSVTSGTGRIRRFNTSDGTADAGYGYLTVFDEGVNLRDIDLACNVDFANDRVVYWAIREDDSLRMYWSDETATTWNPLPPGIGNADRGLDASWDGSTTSNLYAWASYIGTDDSLYAVARFPWTYFGPLDYVGTNSVATTSIATYLDTIMITFPHFATNYDMRYRVSYNEGDNWVYGTLADTTVDVGLKNDITGRNGDGFGVAYQTSVLNSEGFYRHRDYPLSAWSPQVSFADHVTRNAVKPSIERIASGLYGVIYVTYPEEMAYFDKDWLSGIDEEVTNSDGKIECSIDCSIITGTATLKYTTTKAGLVNISMFNVLGQKVATLYNGEQAIGPQTLNLSSNNLAKGIYYIVIETPDGKGTAKATVIK